jgi:hypothetical protein
VKNNRGLIIIAIILIALSTAFYTAHYFIFHDLHHIFIYMLGDLAFLPLEVLLVGIVVERLMERREHNQKIRKLNMVIGIFFSQIGTPLSKTLLQSTPDRENIISKLGVTAEWNDSDYKKARNFAEHGIDMDLKAVDMDSLKSLLLSNRNFMMMMLENPNLLEHETFTDLLLSVFHLSEELDSRDSLTGLPATDLSHLYSDIKRAFWNLSVEWLSYMLHVKSNYPFLYSHCLRTHPFQQNPSAIVK